MTDYIDRQAAIDAMDECYWSIMGDEPPKLDEKTALYVDLKLAVKRLPTAEKKGKWEVCDILDYAQRPSGRKILRCPFCGYLTGEFRSMVDYYHKLTHFCPNCGAKMEESDEHTD